MRAKQWLAVVALAGIVAVLAACGGLAIPQEEGPQPGQPEQPEQPAPAAPQDPIEQQLPETPPRPGTSPEPTEESLQELLDAYQQAFNDQDWSALYTLEPPEFREHCPEAEYVRTLQFTALMVEGFTGGLTGDKLNVRVTDVEVLGSEGYVDMEILLGDRIIATDAKDPASHEPNWAHSNGAWQRHIPNWTPELRCEMGFELQ